MKFGIKELCLNGMGIALFVVLSMCLRVPVFENYYLCLGYIVMAVYSYSSILNGTIIGTLGVFIYCLLINGLRGMPGWVIGNIFIGIFLGLGFKMSKKIKNKLIKIIFISIFIVIGVLIGILGIKSLVEMYLYSQPFILRLGNNIYAFIADIFILFISIPISLFLGPILNKFRRDDK